MMTGYMLAPLVVPILGALAYALAGWRPATAWLGTVSAGLVLIAAIGTAVEVVGSGAHIAAGGLVRVDALSAFLLVVLGAVSLLAAVATPAYVRAEHAADRMSDKSARWHCLLVQLFVASMALAVLAANLGVVWVAFEAITIVTALLIGQRDVAAAWKYVLICSAGLALALLGTVVLNFAAARSSGGLDFAALTADLDPGVTRVAVVLLIVGFGTMAGLAPLHAWLPDAHGEAPAPVAALMSGALLSVGFYAILRVKVISDAVLGQGFARALLAVLALASLLIAATLLLGQRDYPRMLAYSSIQHLGLVAFGAAIGGPLAVAAVLLHILGHGLAKTVLFLGAGRVLQVTGTSQIDGVRGLAARHPVLAGGIGLGVLALLGLPPFSLFASQLGIARAGFAAGGFGWLTAAVLVLVLVIAVALVGHTSRMLLGDPPEGPGAATAPRALPVSMTVALVGGLVACVALGVATGPLSSLLQLAAETVVGAR